MKITLTSEERKELKELQKSHRNQFKLYGKVTTMLMLDMGLTPEAVAESLGIGISTIYRYHRQYEEHGLTGYLTLHFKGYAGKLNPDQEEKIAIELESNLYNTAKEVCFWVKENFNVTYTENGMTALLHRLGFSYKKTRQIPGKANAELQEAFLEKFTQLQKNINEEEVIYFSDGAHPQYNTHPEYAWIKTGQEFHIPSQTGRKRVNINGAINAFDPTDVAVDLPERINGDSTIELCKKLIRKNPTKRKIYFICDNARYNHSKVLKEWIKDKPVEIIYLPPYSPNLNLIERLWKFLKKKVINSFWYDTFDDFQIAIEYFFQGIKQYGKELKSLMTLNFEILGD